MKTLDHWESRLVTVPSTIKCPVMHLIGRDHEAPICIGPGQIDIRSSTAIDFTMFASPRDAGDALSRLNLAIEYPYDIVHQFRLVANDFEGTEWACGWTFPKLKAMSKAGWLLTGDLHSLLTRAEGPWVSKEAGVELVYQPKLALPMDKPMLSVTSVAGNEIARRWSDGQKTVPVLGTEITFFHRPFREGLWVTAKTSDKLPHPFLENWISQPFRIMLGQLVFPRLVARNFGDGAAQVSLRPSPPHFRNPGIASLAAEMSPGSVMQFWELYSNLLTLIAEARDDKNQPNFESHPITRFYEEIAQATQGSRWVLCLTLASAAEGIANLLMTPNERRPEFESADRMALQKTIEAWQGNNGLKKRVLGWFSLLGQRSVPNYLGDLVDRGVLTENNDRDWKAVRNAVMHGTLVSPWPTEEEDKLINSLADLVHRLTRELVRVHMEEKKEIV